MMDARKADHKTIALYRRELQRESRAYPIDRMIEVELPASVKVASDAPFVAFRSRFFLAQVFNAPPPAMYRISVCRTEIEGDGHFKSGITWDALQWIKAQCGFSSSEAIEIYPREPEVVNVSNMRHLWILATPTSLSDHFRRVKQ